MGSVHEFRHAGREPREATEGFTTAERAAGLRACRKRLEELVEQFDRQRERFERGDESAHGEMAGTVAEMTLLSQFIRAMWRAHPKR